MNEQTDPVFAQMALAFFSAEVQQSIQVIKQAAHHDISEDMATPFLAFHAYMTNPQPDFITAWRADPKREPRYHQLVNGVLGNVRGALAAVTYHQENLEAIEAEIRTQLAKIDFASALGNSTVGLGGTQKLDFEYQSYVLAYRRCLDYLTRALSAYFGRDAHSFRKMDRGLGGVRQVTVAQALLDVHARYQEPFRFVLGVGGNTSLRDRIAHMDFVGAGCFNLNRFGVGLVGGGEELTPRFEDQSPLTSILGRRTELLNSCIAEMLSAFAAAAKTESSRGAGERSSR